MIMPLAGLGRLLADDFIKYWLAYRAVVNPGAGVNREFVVAYGGAETDISCLYLATDFTKAYFINEGDIRLEQLSQRITEWGLLAKGSGYFQDKYAKGFVQTLDHKPGEAEFWIIQELKAMGVKKEAIAKPYRDAKGRVVLTFRLPGEAREREIIFVRHNLLRWDAELSEELSGKLDAYYQKASEEAPYYYNRYLGYVSGWLKPGGFMILDDYGSQDIRFILTQLLGDRFMLITIKGAKRLYDKILRSGVSAYGLSMSLWRKKK